VCFERAELYDVVNAETGAKIAGAAQKRNKRGLLFQGSLWRPALGCIIDEEQFLAEFVAQLSALLGTEAVDVPWPDFNDDEVSGLTENYASSEWIEAR
jgi:lipoate-protein ligase A